MAAPSRPGTAVPPVQTTARTLDVLDFPAILARLAGLCGTPLGVERARALAPSSSRLVVQRRQQETSEARALLDDGEGLPLGGTHDVREALGRAARQGVLQGRDLFAIAETARAAERLARHVAKRAARAPRLADRGTTLQDHARLAQAIEAAVAPDGELLDRASPELGRLRRQRQVLSARLRERLESLTHSSTLAPFLQEALVTLRGGRYVVPVKAEHRGQVQGVVHDTSASGATVFVEPLAVVEVNNELRTVETGIRDEERRIRAELSAAVGVEARAFDFTLEALAAFDLIAARARLSAEWDGVAPEGLDGDRIELRRARHPLLKGDVVPIDVRLGGDVRTLLITGPNTGGKTVSLKTVGLLAAMAQAGLHIPAQPGSCLPVFQRILCDAGDEQGVAQNLSTFSSHLSHIVEMLAMLGGAQADAAAERTAEEARQADEPGDRALVLLDELGAGTDPAEGAALAMALLTRFQASGALTLATTHYSELKAFAYREHGLRNASVEFDADTLQPTYRLTIGLPGKSNAFAIAARLGLEEDVLANARRQLSVEDRDVAELLDELSELRDELRQERDAAQRARLEADAQAARARETARALANQRASAEAHARDQAREHARKVRRELDALLERARERLAADDALQAVAEAEAGRQQLDADEAQWSRDEAKAAEALAQRGTRSGMQRGGGDPAGRGAGEGRRGNGSGRPSGEAPNALQMDVGARVHLRSLRVDGEVVEPPGDEAQVRVRVGAMTVLVPLDELTLLEPDPAGRATGNGASLRPGIQLSADRRFDVRSELDLHGLTVDEALAAVDKYLDDAYLAGLHEVRLVHGKGTGALRQAVRRFVHDHTLVSSYRGGGAHEGGIGTTVCVLRAE